MLHNFLSTSVLSLALILCAGCNGSSSSNGFGGSAEIRIEVNPDQLDIGDRARVEIDVKEIHESGIILKIRYPIELTYVAESSEIFVDGKSKTFNPSSIDSVDDDTYIIYRMDENDGGENNHATIVFELRGSASKEEAKIGVDPDVDSTTPFNPETPEFEEEAEVQVEISG